MWLTHTELTHAVLLRPREHSRRRRTRVRHDRRHPIQTPCERPNRDGTSYREEATATNGRLWRITWGIMGASWIHDKC